jgi:lysophospholipase L1-like esterase
MKRLFKTIGLFATSLLLSALLMEAGVLLIVGEQVKFPRHVVGSSFGLRINQPNAFYRHKSADVTVWFEINAQGMRAHRDYPYEKPDGLKRIVSLGDSFTIGYEVHADECFSSIIESDLRQRGYGVEVLNAGVSGYSNAEESLYLERELFRYDPDLILVSFFANDLVDNVRTGLFRLEGQSLVSGASSYVPASQLGDYLNTNPFFNFLSARSNAFVLLKEKATILAKRRMVKDNITNIDSAGENPGSRKSKSLYQRRLAAAIFERTYQMTQERGIPLVIHSIPTFWPHPDRLVDLFPLDEFDVNRQGLAYFPAKDVLEPWFGKKQLYNRNSHGHWTAHSNAVVGRAISRLIDEEGLLD